MRHMLTVDDLQKIQEIVSNSINPLTKDLTGLKLDVSILKNHVSTLQKDVKVLKKQTKRNHNELVEKTNIILNFIEEEDMKIKGRVRRLEEHLQLTDI